jgi:hypothetical protein
MSEDKRSRGRPRGSGKDDSTIMTQIANILVRNPSLKPTTAMRKILLTQEDSDPMNDPTVIRRWQRKWKKEAPLQMLAAKERVRPVSVSYAPNYAAATLDPFAAGPNAAEQVFASICGARSAAEQFRAGQHNIRSAVEQVRASLHGTRSVVEQFHASQHNIRSAVEQVRASLHNARSVAEQFRANRAPIGNI